MKAWKKGAIIGFLVPFICLPINLITWSDVCYHYIGNLPTQLLFFWRTGTWSVGAGIEEILKFMVNPIGWALIGATIGYLIDKYRGREK